MAMIVTTTNPAMSWACKFIGKVIRTITPPEIIAHNTTTRNFCNTSAPCSGGHNIDLVALEHRFAQSLVCRCVQVPAASVSGEIVRQLHCATPFLVRHGGEGTIPKVSDRAP
jgi:hypothetical protein